MKFWAINTLFKERLRVKKIVSLTARILSDHHAKKYNDTNEKFMLHKPGENYTAKNYVVTKHTHRLLKEHLQVTGGQVRTRFPPEPNGLLHIGHAKAVNINFGYAKAQNGICFLRYDDTNPEMEDEQFVHGIQDMVRWLGYEAYKVTYASDYFQQLYEWAEKLIEKDLAYVCHEPVNSSDVEESPWRSRPPSESLQAFRDMKNQRYREGEAVLRLKMTTQQGTVDPVAYRIKYRTHHRTKNEWCIYPTYDYSHCLCDSIENITHSLCTSEFALRRSTYYWICNSLEVYCPVQIEYGRLNFHYTVVSKRKISALIESGVVIGWDDPRLFTLIALKRRGFPPEAINEFCGNFGLRTDNAYIDPSQLYFYVQKHLEFSVPRIMAVLNPLKLVIVNYPYEGAIELESPNVPSDRSKGYHTTTLDRQIWIESTDFQEAPEKGFRRLTFNQAVGIRYAGLILQVVEVVRGTSSGEIDHLKVRCHSVKDKKIGKPKAFIHWVAHPTKAEVRLFENLFKSKRPDDPKTVPEGILSDVNHDSMKTVEALIGKNSLNLEEPFQRFQFERTGYFSVDPDSRPDRLVFNRIMELKQDKGFKGN